MNAVLPSLSVQPKTSPALKIALLGYRSHPHVGGQGIYLKQLSRALVQLGHSVDVLSGPPYPELDPEVGLIKIPSLNLYEHPNHLRALRWRHLASVADTFEWWSMATGGFAEPYTFGRRVVRYLEAHGRHYDVIHDNQSLSYGLLNLQRSGFPIVSTIHHPITRDKTLAINNAKTWLDELGARRWYSFTQMQIAVARKLQHIVTVSEFSKADIADQFGCDANTITVIKNGVDTSVFKPLPNITPVPFRLITTASSDQPLKGFAVLLHALKKIRQELPAMHLVVVGKLNPDGANQALLEKLELENAVQFIHGISATQLNEEYARAQLAVCPSLYEGFGLPAAEAMAAGVPVVSSDGGALPEVVGDAGVIVTAGDANALAQAIKTLVTDAARLQHFKALGLQRILSGFSWAYAAEQLSQYYASQLIDRRKIDRQNIDSGNIESQNIARHNTNRLDIDNRNTNSHNINCQNINSQNAND